MNNKLVPILLPEEQLSLAISFAAEQHHGQMDKGGMPYICHPIAVMKSLLTDDMEFMAGMVMHDLSEDKGIPFERYRQMGFSEKVVNIVDGMTKRPGESVNQYLTRARLNPFVIKGKKKDIRHNMDPERMKGMRKKDMDRTIKYVYMYYMLENPETKLDPAWDMVAA